MTVTGMATSVTRMGPALPGETFPVRTGCRTWPTAAPIRKIEPAMIAANQN